MHKSLDEFDYGFQTSISKREVNSLLDFGFIDNRENVVFIGSPGVGKTHLAIGLGLKAIEAGYKACFKKGSFWVTKTIEDLPSFL